MNQILVTYTDVLFYREDLGNNIHTSEVLLQGMKLFSQKDWIEYQEKVEKLEDIEWYYDTHDVQEYSNGMLLLAKMSVQVIADMHTYGILSSQLCNTSSSFGFFPLLEQLNG